jgi:hypothetical protein
MSVRVAFMMIVWIVAWCRDLSDAVNVGCERVWTTRCKSGFLSTLGFQFLGKWEGLSLTLIVFIHA